MVLHGMEILSGVGLSLVVCEKGKIGIVQRQV